MSRQLLIAGLAVACAAAGLAPSPAGSAPNIACPAPLPAKGVVFSGKVRLVKDGDGICVGPSWDQRTWVNVRLADFYAFELSQPGGFEAKAALDKISRGARVTCVASHKSHDRVVARCSIRGQSLGDRMRAAGIKEGGNGWPPKGR